MPVTTKEPYVDFGRTGEVTIENSMGHQSTMKLKKKYEDRVEIEASRADREALLEFIVGCLLTLEEGGGPATMVDEDDLTEIYEIIEDQKDATKLLVLPKSPFHRLTEIASDWNMMVFANTAPEFHKYENVKKETADLIYALHKAAYP